MTTQRVDKERRLALLLADGSGDFDYVRPVAFDDTLALEGHVKSYSDKQRSEDLARYVGFVTVLNALRVYPEH